jgi:solute carrier family 35 (UDP-sugar transporter), member A1/2/3
MFWSMKSIALIVLVAQNCSTMLVLRYSRISTPMGGARYLSSTAVVMIEVLKVASSSVLYYCWRNDGRARTWGSIFNRTMLLCSIPAALYAVQNNLLFFALSNLDAAVYQVFSQFKVLTTALFSVLLLRKAISKVQWIALLLLMLGVAAVQLSQQQQDAGDDSNDANDANDQNVFVGTLSVLTMAVTSGLAGVYFEKILKKQPTTATTSGDGDKASAKEKEKEEKESNGTEKADDASKAASPYASLDAVWLRNIQLGTWGLAFSAAVMFANDSEPLLSDGFFFGYTVAVYITIALQALGGLVTAVVVRFADNLIKAFATSFSVILSALISGYLFNFELSLLFVAGTALVFAATNLYSGMCQST